MIARQVWLRTRERRFDAVDRTPMADAVLDPRADLMGGMVNAYVVGQKMAQFDALPDEDFLTDEELHTPDVPISDLQLSEIARQLSTPVGSPERPPQGGPQAVHGGGQLPAGGGAAGTPPEAPSAPPSGST